MTLAFPLPLPLSHRCSTSHEHTCSAVRHNRDLTLSSTVAAWNQLIITCSRYQQVTYLEQVARHRYGRESDLQGMLLLRHADRHINLVTVSTSAMYPHQPRGSLITM